MMSGKWKITYDAVLANGDSIAAYLTDVAGNVLTSTLLAGKQRLDVQSSAEYAEDSTHVSGDYGQFVMSVRNDVEGSLVSADGDYAPLQVDSLGRLRVVSDISINNDFVYAEDSASASGNLGASILSVRQDVLATDTSATGDYSFIKANALGEVYVTDTSSLAQLVLANSSLDAIEASVASMDTSLNNIETDIDEMNTSLNNIEASTASMDTSLNNIEADADEMNTSLNNIEGFISDIRKAEDSPHVSGDYGFMSLAVRNDVEGSLVDTNGDYGSLQLDALGRLRVTANFAGQYAEDSASVSGDTGTFSLAVRRDAFGPQTSTTGDYSEFQTWSNGELKTVDICNGSMLQQEVSVTTAATLLPTAALANRKRILVQNVGVKSVWIGAATVTDSGATGGIEVPKGGHIELEAGPAVSVYAITLTSATAVRVLECA